MSFEEKRKNKRISRSFTARINKLIDSDIDSGVSKWDIVQMKDLSVSGIAFNYTSPIPSNTCLQFDIALPFLQEKITCSGRVCRVNEKTQLNSKSTITKPRLPLYIIAAFFDKIDDAKKAVLNKYIENAK